MVTGTEIKKEELGIIFNKCLKLLFHYEPILSKNEIDFLTETIKSKKLPTSTLLIKDHKEQNPDGKFPCRLVIPATNFTAGFPKVGYQGIRAIFKNMGLKL